MEESKISNIILDYCEGIEHLEFSKSDLPEMVEKILNELEDNEEDKTCYPCNGKGYHIETCIEADGSRWRPVKVSCACCNGKGSK